MNQLAYPSGIYEYIYNTALFIHPTHIFSAFHYGMNKACFMGIALYVTSLNYWRYPLLNSYRRKIDMVVAKSSIAYHFYLSMYTSNKLLTALPISVGSSLYLVSLYLYKKKYVKSAAFCHILLHLLVSIGASLTYKDLGK